MKEAHLRGEKKGRKCSENSFLEDKRARSSMTVEM